METKKDPAPKPEDYWTALKKHNLEPNFWMTPEYMEMSGMVWTPDLKGTLWGWKVKEEDCEWFVPPLTLDGIFDLTQPCWASFPIPTNTLDIRDEMPLWENMNVKFLDHQYIYDARKFLFILGGEWKTYRKNIRKYPNRVGGPLDYRLLVEGEEEERIADMLIKWSGGKIIQDNITMTRFFLMGKLRWGLFQDGRLVGVNVGDENHMHAIYRYCLDDGTPYLNEYLRHCFYTSGWAMKHRWVNDGGDLGNPDLARFKRKLNPVAVKDVFTHIRR